MEILWNDKKDRENKKKHGVDFREASGIFDDPLHISILDKRFDYFEERWVTIGTTKKGKLLVVGHLYTIREDGTEIIRIITARHATRKERKQYEKIDS